VIVVVVVAGMVKLDMPPKWRPFERLEPEEPVPSNVNEPLTLFRPKLEELMLEVSGVRVGISWVLGWFLACSSFGSLNPSNVHLVCP